ncbi:MAG TPA: preprotein translocase subunit SecG [Holophagaceae bacterium]|nr:preprotein translocase subunit SecG [Holophagaceae bacterium]
MNSLLITLIVILGILLMGAILLQPGSKGGGLGSSFGGGGANSAFGAQGATPFLAKASYWLAGLFLAAIVFVEVLIVKQGTSVLEKPSALKLPAAAAPAPLVPAAPATAPAAVPAPEKAQPEPAHAPKK